MVLHELMSLWDRIESITLSGFYFVAKIYVEHIRSNSNSIFFETYTRSGLMYVRNARTVYR